MKESIRKYVLELAEPLVHSIGLNIWGLEVFGNPPNKIVLYIDTINANEQKKPDLCESATIEQCEDISRKLGLALDVADCMKGPWTLEVSSPGFERKFFTIEQMRGFEGDLAEASLFEPLNCAGNNTKKIRGILAAVEKDRFIIEPCQIGSTGEIISKEKNACVVEFAQCRCIRRLHVFKMPQKPGKKTAVSKKQHCILEEK